MPKQGIIVEINAETAQALQRMGQFFNTVNSGLSKITAAAGPAALAMLGLGGIHKMEETIRQVLEMGSALVNLKARAGGSIADLVILQRQLRENGGAAESAGMMLNFMQRAIVLAVEEGGASAKVFSDLNLSISLSQLSAMSATEQYKLLGSAIAAIENPAKRTEAVMKVFGRGGGDLAAVFSNPEKFQAAFAGPNAFGQIMARSSEAFHEFERNMDRLASNGKKFTAGFLSQIVPLGSNLAKSLAEIDLSGLGQKLGALVVVIVNAWKANKFPEMIGLLLEAGFEIGIDAIKNLFAILWKAVTGDAAGSIYLGLINGVLAFGVNAGKLLLDIVSSPVTFLAASFHWLWDEVRVGFEHFVNIMKEGFAASINFFINAWNTIATRLHRPAIQPVASGATPVQPAESFKDALGYAREAGKGQTAELKGYLDAQLAATRQILGIDQQLRAGDNARATAVQRLNALIQDQLDKYNKLQAENETKVVPLESRLGALREVERLQKEKLLVLDKQLAAIETDFLTTNAQKYAEKKRILMEQRDAIDAIVMALKERARLEDSTTAEQTLSRADTFGKQSVEKDKAISGLGPDPNSFSQQFGSTMKDLGDQWGTWATQMATTFKDVFNNAVSSISNGITGLIMGTKTWGNALREIGTSILTSIIQAIIQMGVRWVLTQLMMAVAGKAIQASAVAASTPLAVAQAAIWAVPATLATIASYGAAAAAAPGFIALANGLVLAQSLVGGVGAFAEGGRPPLGQMSLVGERGPELFVPDSGGTIVPAHVTAEYLKSRGGDFGPGGAGSRRVDPTINNDNRISFAFYDDKQRTLDHLKSAEGRRLFVDLYRQHAHELK